jgi:pimeloyl-ACP methyl ester carboxylesterase
MSYVERGSGPPLVLVHGALNDYRYWTPQLQGLSDRFRVISVSLRHYYPEPWKGEGEFSLKRHAADVAAFIEALGEPVPLVGHSRGGPVALAVAVDRPQLVRKLVLADPALLSLVSPSGSAADDPRVKRARMAETYFRRGDIEGGLRYFFDDVNGPGGWAKLPEDQRRVRRE